MFAFSGFMCACALHGVFLICAAFMNVHSRPYLRIFITSSFTTRLCHTLQKWWSLPPTVCCFVSILMLTWSGAVVSAGAGANNCGWSTFSTTLVPWFSEFWWFRSVVWIVILVLLEFVSSSFVFVAFKKSDCFLYCTWICNEIYWLAVPRICYSSCCYRCCCCCL